MDSQALEQRIVALQAELMAVKTQTVPQYQPQIQLQPVMANPSMETTEDMVKRLIDEKLKQVLATQPTVQQPMDYGQQLLVAVGSALNEEQQLWLSKDENRIDIPKFLSSIEGQALTRRFFTNYKDYKETSQCK